MVRYIVITLLLFSCSIHAQKLIVGGHVVFPFNTTLETVSDIGYYYADDINSSYLLVPEESLRTRSFFSMKGSVQYMLNDNWFFDYEVGYSPYLKEYNIYYNTTYVNNINLKTRFDYSYITNSLLCGYKFLKTKEIRPKLYIGTTSFSLFRFKEVVQRAEEYRLVNQYPYGQVIHQQISTYKNNFFNYTIGFGLEYYVLKFDIVYERSFNKTGTTDFYGYYHSFYFSIGMNLATFDIKSRKVKKYKAD